jgi:hypothetical protein
MEVRKILYADIFRDGGSYGFGFEAADGRRYEFFLQTTAFSAERTTTHQAPVIYREDRNSGDIVQSLSWEEAKEFVAPLRYSDRRFDDLVKIVANEGKKITRSNFRCRSQ